MQYDEATALTYHIYRLFSSKILENRGFQVNLIAYKCATRRQNEWRIQQLSSTITGNVFFFSFPILLLFILIYTAFKFPIQISHQHARWKLN